ncbi:MAG: hypothetical protein IT332_04430 [Ardenticatenales bacterium]|nr:hypothetical protein [Ardenticatenales bacterium]
MNLADQPTADRIAIIGVLIERLPDYLATDALFLPVMAEHGGRHDPISLTLGVLLDALDALAAAAPPEARALEVRLHAAAALHPDAYAAKLHRELRSAVAVWKATADDLVREPERGGDGWHEAARQRTRAAQILVELERIGVAPQPAAQASLSAADAAARPNTVPAPFAGRPLDAGRFPVERFWWLWRRPAAD